ncbi:UDP-N-acetylglucosamine-peptide N-acetylglucosaminyltransferase [Methylocella silvestris]|nr:UDP-N-acetylglucosamine-peptide N-acetylglucosaminyltransferase [Methylocella silvestris]
MKSLPRRLAMCEWAELADAAPRMRAALAAGGADRMSPFLFLSIPGVNAQEHRRLSEDWIRARRATSMDGRVAFAFDLGSREKIRIGYLSNDFHDHATSLLLIETFEAHDRARFEAHAFCFGADDGSAMRGRLRDAFHAFHDVAALSDAEAAQAIHDAGIDILIDLKGYTKGARTGILLLHPAPVQVNYLGYAGTLGGDLCDYLITDAHMTPGSAAADYSESFAYMPHSYQPRGRKGAIGAKPTRAEAGLPEQGFVFCCFNQAYKITPAVFDLWRRLLDEFPGSVLWLLRAEQAEGNLRGEALRRGVSPDRLIFAPDMNQVDHLGRLQLADLVLDTSPYGAHTTASDALWAGVPIVTFAGETFPSRVAGSLLHAVGMPELIAADAEEYLAIASVLASEPERLAALKTRLRQARLTAPLFDVGAYTRALEALFETMWSRRRGGLPAAAIWASVIKSF